jgi:hypothetical protein
MGNIERILELKNVNKNRKIHLIGMSLYETQREREEACVQNKRGYISQSRHSARLSLQVVRIGSPRPHTSQRVCPHFFGSKGKGTHSLVGEWSGGANSEEGTDILLI